jgi:uncharacterized repeat protein (TIGR03803 family)
MTNVSWRTIIAICLLGLPVTAGSQTLTTIYSFPNRPTGSGPGALSYRNGTLYGTTELGGASNSGALFRLNVATNHEKTLYSFPTDNNNLALSSLLINGSTIYGNSYYGGPNPCIGGGACGTIFSFSPETGAADVLYTFTGAADGAHPNPGLIYANGLIYGTTAENGQGNGCCGTLFSLDPSTGSLSVLYTFGASQYDAVRPAYGPIKVGNFLYGATEYVEGGTRAPSSSSI